MEKIVEQTEGNRTIYTYAYLYQAAKNALLQTKPDQKGHGYNCMSAIIFCAFTLEAYFNNLGKQKLHSWEKIERKLGPREKLALIGDILNHPIDVSQRPFQTFTEIFKLRDALAHGKTEQFRFENIQKVFEEGAPREPEPFWMSLCNITSAKRCVEDTKAIIEELHKFAEQPFTAFGVLEEGEWVSGFIKFKFKEEVNE
jgi:hypothetical protein